MTDVLNPLQAADEAGANQKTGSRTLKTLVIAGLAILILGFVRPTSPKTGMFDEQFWAHKMGWHERFDVVLAGDSRVYRGVSPEEMTRQLPGYRIGNYGFSSAGYGKEYLARLPGLLAPESSHKTLVLGITPNDLDERSANEDNGFLSLLKRNPLDLTAERVLGPVLGFFRPYSLSDVARAITCKRKGYYQDYRPSGWVASFKLPEDQTDTLRAYRERWQSHKLSPAIQSGLLAKVNHWHRQGIRVYGFYPPTSQALHDLEITMSGFDEQEFKARFERAGGIWIDVELRKYHSYDGSHLRNDSAISFSRDLAGALNL